MPQANFDIIIARKINFFKFHALFNDLSTQKTDSLAVTASFGEVKINFNIVGITWCLTDVMAADLQYKADFACAVLNGSKPFTNSFITVKVNIEKLATPDVNEWFDAYPHFENAELDSIEKEVIFHSFKSKLAQVKNKLAAIFFKGGTFAPANFGSHITESRFFCKINTQNIGASYLCIGCMLDGRALPVEAGFPVDAMASEPGCLFYLSPYAYLRQGVSQNFSQAFPNQAVNFNERGDEVWMANLPMDKKAVAEKLGISSSIIDSATITELRFSIKNACFGVSYKVKVRVIHTNTVFSVSPGGGPFNACRPTGVKNYYTINISAATYHYITLQNGELTPVENTALKEEHFEKVYDIPGLEELNNKLLMAIPVFIVSFIVPVAGIAVLGLGLIAGSILLAVCSALAGLLEDALNNSNVRANIAEMSAIRSLYLSVAKLLVFPVNYFEINQFYLNNGLIICCDEPKQYLVQGSKLLPGQCIINSLGNCLAFQPDGNLVLYERVLPGMEMQNPLWASDGDLVPHDYNKGVIKQMPVHIANGTGSSLTIKTDSGDEEDYNTMGVYYTRFKQMAKVEFTNDGNLVMFAGNKIIWQSHTKNSGAKILFIQDKQVCLTAMPETDFNQYLSGELSAPVKLVDHNSFWNKRLISSFQNPKHYLLPGDELLPGQYITNKQGNCLVFQPDGNLVLYERLLSGGEMKSPLWCSDRDSGYDTFGENATKVRFTNNGNMVMYGRYDSVLWQSCTENLGANILFLKDNRVCLAAASERVFYEYLSGNFNISSKLIRHDSFPIKAGGEPGSRYGKYQ